MRRMIKLTTVLLIVVKIATCHQDNASSTALNQLINTQTNAIQVTDNNDDLFQQSFNYLQMVEPNRPFAQQHQQYPMIIQSGHHQPTKYKKPVHVTISQESVNRLLTLILLSVISVAGSMGAIFIMSALTVIESLQTRGNCYMVSISMSHLLVNLLVLPSSALQLMSLDNALEARSLCYYQWKMLLFTMIVNHLSFLLMAADKYLAMKASEKVKTSYRIEDLTQNVPPSNGIVSDNNQYNKVEDKLSIKNAEKRTNNDRKSYNDDDDDADDRVDVVSEQLETAKAPDEQSALEIQEMLNQINQAHKGSYKNKTRNNQNLSIATTMSNIDNFKRFKHLALFGKKTFADESFVRRAKKPSSFAAQIAISQRDKNIEAQLLRPKFLGYRNVCGRLRVLIWILAIWLFAFVYTIYENELTFGADFCQRASAINQSNLLNNNNITSAAANSTKQPLITNDLGQLANGNRQNQKVKLGADYLQRKKRLAESFNESTNSSLKLLLASLSSSRTQQNKTQQDRACSEIFAKTEKVADANGTNLARSNNISLDAPEPLLLLLLASEKIPLERVGSLQHRFGSDGRPLSRRGDNLPLSLQLSRNKNVLSSYKMRTNDNIDADGPKRKLDVSQYLTSGRKSSSVKCLTCARSLDAHEVNSNRSSSSTSYYKDVPNNTLSLSDCAIACMKTTNHNNIGGGSLRNLFPRLHLNSSGANRSIIQGQSDKKLMESLLGFARVKRSNLDNDAFANQLKSHSMGVRSANILRSNTNSSRQQSSILSKQSSTRRKLTWFAMLLAVIGPNIITGLLFTRAYVSMKQFKSRPYSTLPIEALASCDLTSIMQTSELIKHHKIDVHSNVSDNHHNLLVVDNTIDTFQQQNSLEFDEKDNSIEISNSNKSPLSKESSPTMLRQQRDNLSTIISQASDANSAQRRKILPVLEKNYDNLALIRKDFGEVAHQDEALATGDMFCRKLSNCMSPKLTPKITTPIQTSSDTQYNIDRLLLNRTPSERYTCSRIGPNEYATSLQRDTSFSAPPTARLPHSADWTKIEVGQLDGDSLMRNKDNAPLFEQLFEKQLKQDNVQLEQKSETPTNIQQTTSKTNPPKETLRLFQMPQSNNLIPISNRNIVRDVLSNLAIASAPIGEAPGQDLDDTLDDTFDVAPAFRTGRCASDQTAAGSVQHQWLMAQLGVPNYQLQQLQHQQQQQQFNGNNLTNLAGQYEFRRDQHHAQSFHYGGSKRNYPSRYSQFLSPLQQPQCYTMQQQQQQQQQQHQQQQTSHNIAQQQQVALSSNNIQDIEHNLSQDYCWPAGLQHAHSARVSPIVSRDQFNGDEATNQHICSSDSQLQNNHINTHRKISYQDTTAAVVTSGANFFYANSNLGAKRTSNTVEMINSATTNNNSLNNLPNLRKSIVQQTSQTININQQHSPTSQLVDSGASQPVLTTNAPLKRANLLSLVQKHRESPSPTASSRSHLADRLLTESGEDCDLDEVGVPLIKRKSDIELVKVQQRDREVAQNPLNLEPKIITRDKVLEIAEEALKKLKRSSTPRHATLYAYAYMPEDQLLRSNIIVFAFNLTLWVPLILLWLTSQYKIYVGFPKRSSGLEWAGPSAELKDLVWWIATINCWTSSYIYALTNKDFRDAFNKLFYYFCCKAHVTFPRKTAIFRRQLDVDSEGKVKLHIIPGLNTYSSKLNQMLGSNSLGTHSPLANSPGHFHYQQHHHQHNNHQFAHHTYQPSNNVLRAHAGHRSFVAPRACANSMAKMSAVSTLQERKTSHDWQDYLPDQTCFENSPKRVSRNKRPIRRDSANSTQASGRQHHMSVGGGFGGPLFASARRNRASAAQANYHNKYREYSSNYYHPSSSTSTVAAAKASRLDDCKGSHRRKFGRNSERSTGTSKRHYELHSNQ